MARRSQVYPFALCRAILMGCRRQMLEDERILVGAVGITPKQLKMDDQELERECVELYNLELGKDITLT